MVILYIQAPTLYLSGSGVIIGATSISLTSLTDIYGNVLTMADFGTLGYVTLEPDTTNAEAATFTGITANANSTYTLTGVKTGLAKSPYTETSGLVRNHAGGTKLVVTDSVGFWNTFLNKNNVASIGATYTFTVVPTITVAPTASTDAVNKAYADGLAIAGSPDSSTTVKGIGRVSVAPVSPTTPIFVGDNDGRVPTQGENDALVGNNTDIAVGTGNKFVTQTGLQKNTEKYAADSGSSTAYAATFSPVPTSYTTGMVFYVKATSANTTTTPTFNANSLGAKTIVKATSNALAVGDIQAGMFCTLIYDGTNMVLQNPVMLRTLTRLAGYTSALNTTENTVFTTTVPANLLGFNGMIRVRVPLVVNTNLTAETLTIRLKYGGSTIGSLIHTTNAVGAGTNTTALGFLEGWIINSASTASQNVSFIANLGLQITNQSNFASNYINNFADTTSAIDTTASQTLAMTIQRTTGTANCATAVFSQAVVETIYN